MSATSAVRPSFTALRQHVLQSRKVASKLTSQQVQDVVTTATSPHIHYVAKSQAPLLAAVFKRAEKEGLLRPAQAAIRPFRGLIDDSLGKVHPSILRIVGIDTPKTRTASRAFRLSEMSITAPTRNMSDLYRVNPPTNPVDTFRSTGWANDQLQGLLRKLFHETKI